MAKHFDPEIGLNTRFRPGESGNPSGRPRQKPIVQAVERALQRNPKLLDQIALTALRKAARGDVRFFCEIRDMLDGRPIVPVEQSSEQPESKNRFENMDQEELLREVTATRKRLAEIDSEIEGSLRAIARNAYHHYPALARLWLRKAVSCSFGQRLRDSVVA